MNKYFIALSFICLLAACKSKSAKAPATDSLKPNEVVKAPEAVAASTDAAVDTTAIPASTIAKQMFGMWGVKGSHVAELEINSTRMYYVTRGASYTYKLKGDSVTVKYGDHSETFKVGFKGADELILSNKKEGEKAYSRL